MSFQNFRLGPPPPHHAFSEIDTPPHSTLSAGQSSSLSPPFGQLSSDSGTRVQSPSSATHFADNSRKGLYGSGDADDRYTLIFENMDAFEAWRQREEEEKMVEFVKGDTHASKAVPPRFKEHTKLVCGRHSRGGRKKYVKKYPDRVRKVPSRKLEGIGCPASISYKTYFDTEEVRACYISDHSHETGLANLPFTKRGRKAQAEMDARATGERPRGRPRKDRPQEPEQSSSSPQSVSFMDDAQNAVAGPSSAPQIAQQHQQPPPQMPESQQTFQSSIAMLAPLPSMAHVQQTGVEISQERWDRMGVLFQSIRDHARSFEFPAPSVAALESVLIRLYLESPIGGGLSASVPAMDGMHGGVGMGGPSMDGRHNHHGAGT
ncbi:hypothetical protein BD309DRAFT_946421 [Dichomitus squalens]|uniref:Uncharacterized protein n=1 Tax=Dichomitus squalens TaxID=114155 RepID=A0A4V2K5V6_9APHY|nr:uncharacterized protein DICSQDRAFT_95605 [Dichomitus squalens LYAD-421 SS1]EJF66816.1 hypothetical protein DICSQDRAFT_95605 [Dichomitus squalens LYAD-421 SS1]TBU49873.1 hypothetical protein BD309DRAFT_946421 [Dichomitus squalens]TBU63818.1 hypothetical protein BD310DRAFT_526331 [Dichomitus squalens]